MGTGRVSNHWISAPMRGQEATLERLRVDRQLEEATVQGPAPSTSLRCSASTRRPPCATRTPHGPCWIRQPRPTPRVDPEPTGPSPKNRAPHPQIRTEEPSVSANSRGSPGVSSCGAESAAEIDHGPALAAWRALTRFSYSRRPLRCAGTVGAPWVPSRGWQRARNWRWIAGVVLTPSV